MKNPIEVTERFIEELYDYSRFCKTKGDVEAVLRERATDVELTDEEMERATQIALEIQDNEIYYMDIAERAILLVLGERKKKSQDLLNDTLKMIGLETNQGFLVNDDEYRGTTFYIDSFGDIYTNGEDEDVYHEYLTLGRILTQYYDKVVPMKGKKT